MELVSTDECRQGEGYSSRFEGPEVRKEVWQSRVTQCYQYVPQHFYCAFRILTVSMKISVIHYDYIVWGGAECYSNLSVVGVVMLHCLIAVLVYTHTIWTCW
jgi:hypothetical protein